MKLMLIVAAVCLATLAGCSQKPTFVLVADEGQIGKGAKLILHAGSGTITMAPGPGWPAGLNEQVEGDATRALEELNGGHMWSAKVPSKHLTLTFVVVRNHYICNSCAGLQLPLEWTKQEQ